MNTEINEPKIIMACYTEETIRVYQAYGHTIADQALRLGRFGSAFKLDRMTWIKPSFLWMMYRSGWATKEGQEKILAVDITREGFDEILSKAVLSTYNAEQYGTHEEWKQRLVSSSVRCQWDPDRDIHSNHIGRRAIQLGLSKEAIRKYVYEWVVKITDITDEVCKWREQISAGSFDPNVLPEEAEYPVSEEIKKILRM